jgi:hypothetical protein
MFFIAYPVNALNLESIFEQNLSRKPTGNYEQDGYLFFITEAQCLDTSKHAGSVEAKKAEVKFYAQLVKEMKIRNVRIAPHSVMLVSLARQAEQLLISSNIASAKVTHYKVADIRLPQCVRRQVRAVALSDFAVKPQLISANQVKKKVGEILISLLKKKEYSELVQVFSDTGLTQSEFTTLYKLFAVLEFPKSKFWVPSSHIEHTRSIYDINGVLAAVKSNQGIIYPHVLSTNKVAAEILYQQASELFKQGINPVVIEQKLTLSINIDPQQVKSWKLLSSLFRSISPDEATYAAMQYFIYSDASLSSWVSLFKALEITSPIQAKAIQTIMSYIIISVDMTAWEVKQIKG